MLVKGIKISSCILKSQKESKGRILKGLLTDQKRLTFAKYVGMGIRFKRIVVSII